MMRELLPYYVSRAILAGFVGWLISTGHGLWVGILMGGILYAGFIWYAHSGWYLIDTTHPLSPLRRDARGNAIRDRAVVISVVVAGLLFVNLRILERVFSFEIPIGIGSIALITGTAMYFVVTIFLFTRR